jgi:hypothetical protein
MFFISKDSQVLWDPIPLQDCGRFGGVLMVAAREVHAFTSVILRPSIALGAFPQNASHNSGTNVFWGMVSPSSTRVRSSWAVVFHIHTHQVVHSGELILLPHCLQFVSKRLCRQVGKKAFLGFFECGARGVGAFHPRDVGRGLSPLHRARLESASGSFEYLQHPPTVLEYRDDLRQLLIYKAGALADGDRTCIGRNRYM